MTQRVTRELFERRYQNRVDSENAYGVYSAKARADQMDQVMQETEARAVMRQKMSRQRVADEEYAIAERLYNQQKEQEDRRNHAYEQDAIAQALAEQEHAELVDQKTRGLLRENDAEYRDLKAKLDLALVSQTRDRQRKEIEMRRKEDEEERVEEEQQMLKHYQEEERVRQMDEDEKHRATLATRSYIQDQLRDKERRRQLLEVAEKERDHQQVAEIVARVQQEDRRAQETYRNKQQHEFEEMQNFMRARTAMKEREAREIEAEQAKMDQFTADVDERLRRAQEQAKQREELHDRLAQRIAEDIGRKKKEQDEYENLCLELAEQQEIQRLKEREEAEAAKIRRQIEECQRYMAESQRAKEAEKVRTRAEEARLQRQIIEQQERIAQLAEVEQEQNRIRTEQFKRELKYQLVQKKEMYEQARQAELRKLEIEKRREDDRQRMLNEERRKLVVSHIIAMGPDAVQYLPKGVLKEEDLDYLPEDIRYAIFNRRKLEAGEDLGLDDM